MRRRTKVLFLILLPLLALAGCATGYQKEGVFTNGYSDYRLSPDTFVVTYRANEHTAPEKALHFALKRASELARKGGFSHFEIVDQMGAPHLHYPSIRLTIKCFDHKPLDRETIDALHYLALNPAS